MANFKIVTNLDLSGNEIIDVVQITRSDYSKVNPGLDLVIKAGSDAVGDADVRGGALQFYSGSGGTGQANGNLEWNHPLHSMILSDESLAVTLADKPIEVNTGTGTLAQLAKVHKCIRVLASDIGYTFDEIKLLVKDRAGLVTRRAIKGKEYMDWKSFGNCSREDLNLAIQACIEIGDDVGSNLR